MIYNTANGSVSCLQCFNTTCPHHYFSVVPHSIPFSGELSYRSFLLSVLLPLSLCFLIILNSIICYFLIIFPLLLYKKKIILHLSFCITSLSPILSRSI